MSSWQVKLQSFIDQQITREIEIFKKENIKSTLTEDEEKTIKEHMRELAVIEDSDNGEPKLTYLDLSKKITPREHLEDLLKQLRDDVYPLLRVPSVTPGGAPFTVLRNVFSYLDYVALLRYGPAGNNYGRGIGNMYKILDNFGPADMQKRYRQYKEYLIQIYRHDLVHLTSPRYKIMKVINKNAKENIEKVGFSIITGTINDKKEEKKKQILQDFEQGCLLMKSEKFRDKIFFHLRLDHRTPTINSFSMFFDLANYIIGYQDSLKKDEKLNRDFAENFIAANLSSALKLFNKRSLNMLENSHIFFNSPKFKKS